MFFSLAFLITGTIRFPSGNAVAIPILIFFFRNILCSLTEELINGNSSIALATTSIKMDVKVNL